MKYRFNVASEKLSFYANKQYNFIYAQILYSQGTSISSVGFNCSRSLWPFDNRLYMEYIKGVHTR